MSSTMSSAKPGNESSSSSEIQPYPDRNDPNIINKTTRANNDDENDGEINNLLRTVSQYTEYSVATGEAIKNEIDRETDLEKGGDGSPPQQPPRYPFFSPENKTLRINILKQYAVIMVLMWAFILGVWSIYWGSMFQRETRLVNLSYLVNLETDENAPISYAMKLATTDGPMPHMANWVFKSNMSEAEIRHEIHQQNYWAAIYVTEDNISDLLINAFQNGENINTTGFINAFYETAKDPNAMEGIIIPTLYHFQSYLQKNLQSTVYPELIDNLTSTQFSNLKDTNVLTSYPIINYIDGISVDSVTNGPLQVGLIYIIIITFFEVMWMTQLYGMVAKNAVTKDYIIFRVILSQVNYLLISLAFTCLNAAFQIKMDNTWSGGFGVFWMVSYLTMAAVGGANQNAALILFAWMPPLMGYWMLFFVMINISATFAPIPLCPEFFRFTYAMPIKNAYELMKIVLFDTSRRALGRYFGILIAWIVVNNLLLPFCMMAFAMITKKKIMKQAQQELANKND